MANRTNHGNVLKDYVCGKLLHFHARKTVVQEELYMFPEIVKREIIEENFTPHS